MTSRIQRRRQIRALREAVLALEQMFVEWEQAAAEPHRTAPAQRARRPIKISAKRRADLKLQGRYMGYIRQLKPRQKAKIKALKAKNGYTAAIKLAKQLATR